MSVAKRLLAFLLCMIMIVSLFGCTQVEVDDTDEEEDEEVLEDEDEEDKEEEEDEDTSDEDEDTSDEDEDTSNEDENTSDEDEDTSDEDSDATESESEEESTESETESETVDPNRPTEPSKAPAGSIVLAEHGYPYYRVVYQKSLAPAVKNNIKDYVSKLETKLGVVMECVDDTTLPAPTNGIPEILIGITNRADSKSVASVLRTGEYKISYNKDTKNVIIAAAGGTAVNSAIEKFFKDNLNTVDKYFAVAENYKLENILDFPIQSITINGVAIQEYVIVTPTNPDSITKYAALNLADYIENNMGVKLTINEDKKSEKQYEILVGKTKRSESKISASMKTGQYVLMKNGDKIVMQGNGIYVGAAVGTFVSKIPATGNKKAITVDDLSTTAKAATFKFPTTQKNAIILIGDGMGFKHIEMAKNGGMTEFYAEQFPNKGEAVTRSLSVIDGKEGYTDSAAAATALATGYKTYNGRVGVGASKETLKNIRELADEKGANTAVVTTDVIGGATPGGFLAHNSQRKVNNVTNPDIIRQIDDLIAKKKVDYTMGRSSDSADAPNPDILKGTREALSIIATGGDQFFMMVEAAYIDKDSHNNRYDQCVAAVKQYNEVIAYLSTFVFCHPTTTLVVTADHETGALTADSSYKYGFKYTSGSSSYRQHTNKNVPVFAIGPNTEYFNGYAVENVCIPHFSAKAFGNNNFGDPNYTSKRTRL